MGMQKNGGGFSDIHCVSIDSASEVTAREQRVASDTAVRSQRRFLK